MASRYFHRWTKEEVAKLRELYRDQAHTLTECAELMGRTPAACKDKLTRLHINHGDKRPHSATQYKKGHLPSNHKPVGSEYLKKDGYIWVKVAEPRFWKTKHRLVYEQHYGKLKTSEAVIFLNGDTTDCRIENLMKVTRSELVRINQLGLHSDNTEIGRAKALLGKIAARTRKR